MSHDTRRNSTPRGTIPSGIDDDVADYIRKQRRESEEQLKSQSDRTKQVTPDVCALMRETARREESKREVARIFEWVCYDQVLHHVNGECECDERTHVHYQECMQMRIHAHNGAPPSTLALLNDIAEDTVFHHLSGDCSHEDGIRPLPTSNGPVPCGQTADD